MAKQKFLRGHRVQVAKDLGNGMRHFTNDCEAIVVGSYADICGGGSSGNQDYKLMLFPKGKKPYSSAWYYEHQLTKLPGTRLDGEKTLQQLRRA